MDDAREVIAGNVTLFEATIRETIGSNRQVVRECKTEDERVAALKEVFGIELTTEEREGIPALLRLG